jgi:hypothetical protein
MTGISKVEDLKKFSKATGKSETLPRIGGQRPGESGATPPHFKDLLLICALFKVHQYRLFM